MNTSTANTTIKPNIADEDGWWDKFWKHATNDLMCSECPFEEECRQLDQKHIDRTCGDTMRHIFLTHYTEGKYEYL